MLIILFIGILPVYATSCCCSHHGGVVGCSSGYQLCADGSLRLSCTCESSTAPVTSPAVSSSTKTVSGCTNSTATNYNKSATNDDGSCEYTKTIKVSEVIPYENTYEEDSSLGYGEEVVKTDGSYGLRTITYEVTLDSNSKELSRKEISNEVTTPAINKVISKNSSAVEDKTETTMAKEDNKASSGDVLAGIITLGILVGGPVFLFRKKFKK